MKVKGDDETVSKGCSNSYEDILHIYLNIFYYVYDLFPNQKKKKLGMRLPNSICSFEIDNMNCLIILYFLKSTIVKNTCSYRI